MTQHYYPVSCSVFGVDAEWAKWLNALIVLLLVIIGHYLFYTVDTFSKEKEKKKKTCTFICFKFRVFVCVFEMKERKTLISIQNMCKFWCL